MNFAKKLEDIIKKRFGSHALQKAGVSLIVDPTGQNLVKHLGIIYQTLDEDALLKAFSAELNLKVADSATSPADLNFLENYGFFKPWIYRYVKLKNGVFLSRYPIMYQAARGSTVMLASEKLIYSALNEYVYSRYFDDFDKVTPNWFDFHQFFFYLLARARFLKSSDIHLSYDDLDQATSFQFRLNNEINEIEKIYNSGSFHDRLVNIVYSHAQIQTSDTGKLHDSSIHLTTPGGDTYNIRVASLPSKTESATYHPAISLRLLGTSSGSQMINELGFSPGVVSVFKRHIRQPNGLILLTGPTGSGKTTTLYAMLREKSKEPVRILSVEDPVEVKIPGVMQVEVNQQINLTFVKILRTFLRADPDVILVGEIRDAETAQEAVKAALTGHLVFSSLHTNTAFGVIPRLTGTLGIDPMLCAETLRLVINQRLVKKLCSCAQKVRVPDEVNKDFLEEYGHHFSQCNIYKPKGCHKCKETGYRGRAPLYEIMMVDANLKKAIAKGIADEETAFSSPGSVKMLDVAKNLIQKGITTIQEVEKYVPLSSYLFNYSVF